MNTQLTRLSADALTPPLTLLKLGGSLLDLPDLVVQLTKLVAEIPYPLILPGGGSAADLVRSWDKKYRLPPETAHELALAAMSFNAVRLAESCNRFCLVSDSSNIESAHADGRIPFIDALAMLREVRQAQPSCPVLPESWDVTSDSIAAWLARCLGADLWLLKSVRPGPDPASHLDRWFERAGSGLSQITWVSFRERPAWQTIFSLPFPPQRISRVSSSLKDWS